MFIIVIGVYMVAKRYHPLWKFFKMFLLCKSKLFLLILSADFGSICLFFTEIGLGGGGGGGGVLQDCF